MRDRKAIQGVAVLVTLGAVGAMALTWHGGFAPRVDPEPHWAAGWGLARQALQLVKPGGPIIVITRDTKAFKSPAADLQLASFRKELRKAGRNIETLHAIQLDPLRPMEVPPGDFLEWIRNSPEGSVIVSFMGPPLLRADQRAQLREIKPAIVAFCSGSLPEQVDLEALFEHHLLHAAVVALPSPKFSAKAKGESAWFDQYFVAVTSDNASDWSPQTEGAGSAHSP